MTHRYVGNVRKEVDADTIEADLVRRGIRNVKVALNMESERSKSFKVSFNWNDGDKVDDATFWPSNAVIRRWHHPRQPRPVTTDRSYDSVGTAASRTTGTH